MRKKLLLAVVLLAIAAAVIYLERPDLITGWFAPPPPGGPSEGPLGLLDNPPGEDVGLSKGQAAPDFALKTLDGGVLRLSHFRGEKNVIVNFWASWCGPCKLEMPDLEEAFQAHPDELVVLGVDLQESASDIKQFLDEEVSVSYPILLDDQGKVAGAYNQVVQPTSFLVDKAGLIWDRKFGAYTAEELREDVVAFLAAGSTSTSRDATLTQAGAAEVVAMPNAINPMIRSETVIRGNLGARYFGPGEIRQLGLDIDLDDVPYRADLDLDVFLLGCPVVDCISSIDAPRFEPVGEADWLDDDDLVITVSHRGVTKAYPVNILNWHEIVNDDFEGTAVVVSYCPLCNSALAFEAPVIDGEAAEFGVSGRLYNSDLILYDRVSKSMWSQIEREVIAGPLTGAAPALSFLPLDLVPWGVWKTQHPDSLLLARPTTEDALGGEAPRDAPGQGRMSRDFSNDPYRHYKTNPYDLRFPVSSKDRRLTNKTDVVGVEVGQAAKAYPREAVVAAGLINDELGGRPLVLVNDHDQIHVFQRPSQAPLWLDGQQLADGVSTWSLDGSPVSASEPLEPVLSMPLFWFAWATFHPDTDVYQTPS